MGTFVALLQRDLLVVARNPLAVFGQTVIPALVAALVFGNLLPGVRLVTTELTQVIIGGLVAVTIFTTGVLGVLIPLAVDLTGDREIDERLLAPTSVAAIALEKVAAGAAQALLAGMMAFAAILGIIQPAARAAVQPDWALAASIVALECLVAASFGLLVGTTFPSRMLGLLYPVLIGPMLVFGCVYYPWTGLEILGSLQYVFLLNPVVYMTEALRLALTPSLPHMPATLSAAALVLLATAFTLAGAREFERRTIL